MKKVEDYVRTIPDFPEPGIMFRDVTSVLQDPEGLKLSIDEMIKKLETLSFTKKDARNFIRFFTSSAISLGFDKQGRINIPSYLLDYATLKEDVIIIGVINRIEIWDRDNWNSFMKENVESLSDISYDLFDSSLGL